ncbi:MAG TPA: hypothetical protein DEB06_10790 [Phycisphaerales bacterium]|nr:hypothetical protein [Phycisphaerales bacterium]
MSERSLVIGVDLGGTNMQIGVVDAQNRVLGQEKRKTKAEQGADAIVDRLARGIAKACEIAGASLGEVRAVGIGAPGAIDYAQGVVIEAPNLGWRDFPLAERLSAALGGRPVLLDNDVNVAVYGENKLGAGKDARDLLGVWVGTGVGGGLVLNGSLYYGGFGTAGEIGQMILFPRAALGHRTVEESCSRKNVVARISRLAAAQHRTMLSELTEDMEDIGAGTVAKAYEMGDDLTRRVVNEAADLLGDAIGSCVTLLALPRVILGGGLTEALGQPFVERVATAARAVVFPTRLRAVEFAATTLEDRAGLLGAALLAREKFVSAA